MERGNSAKQWQEKEGAQKGRTAVTRSSWENQSMASLSAEIRRKNLNDRPYTKTVIGGGER